MIGNVDEGSRDRIRGWAWDPDHPDRAVTVEVYVDGRYLTNAVANIFREDVQRAGIGTGRYGFQIDLADFGSAFSSYKLRVRVEGDQGELDGSPVLLAACMEFDHAAERSFAALLASPGSTEQLGKRLLFLTGQVEQMLERLADQPSQRRHRAIGQGHKWRWRPQDGPEPQAAPLRALVIDETTPTPGRDAGSNALLSHMQSLQRIGYQVSFVAADLDSAAQAAHLNDLGIIVHASPWAGSVEEILRRQSGQLDLVYMHRVAIVTNYGKLVSHHMRNARRVYAVADLHHVRLLRQAEAEDQSPPALHYAQHVMRQELAGAASSHAVITHSSFEAGVLRAALPRANVIVAPWECEREPTPNPFCRRKHLAFVGSFRHAPNRDAAVWLAGEIMPLVWRTNPSIVCLVVGADPPKYLQDLNDSRIRVLGHVPDLDAVLSTVRLTVAPLLFGAGLKGKVIDSLAAGVPCVCSPIAAEGFTFDDTLARLVAEDAPGLAERILQAHDDAETFASCRAAGIAHVKTHFCRTLVDARLRAACGLPPLSFA